MITFPWKFRPLSNGTVFVANEAGDFFFTDEEFLENFVLGKLTIPEKQFLSEQGFTAPAETDLAFQSYLSRLSNRQTNRNEISYVILVPTLRCDLSCSYCQVSRVSEKAKGFDWDEETILSVIRFLSELSTSSIKIEFQGGEPTLRMDILTRISDFCDEQFKDVEIVVCTNLETLGADHHKFFDRPNVQISTSLDGNPAVHAENRTKDKSLTNKFFNNLKTLTLRHGPSKISALPTIDLSGDYDLHQLYDAYEKRGFKSIYFRPINYQGFARKVHASSADNYQIWKDKYFEFIEILIEKSTEHEIAIDEYHFTLCLKRFFQAGHDSHVDLRNPNPLAKDYVVVDFDGKLYPTDEARMLTRIGQIDLSIGSLSKGIDKEKIADLNQFGMNNVDEECIHCPYQYACGTDLVDDLSRYGRIDTPKAETWFCKRQLATFDKIARDVDENQGAALQAYEKWLELPPHTLQGGIARNDPADHQGI